MSFEKVHYFKDPVTNIFCLSKVLAVYLPILGLKIYKQREPTSMQVISVRNADKYLTGGLTGSISTL